MTRIVLLGFFILIGFAAQSAQSDAGTQTPRTGYDLVTCD